MMIQRYRFGKITIDGQTYTSDVMILPAQVCDGWHRENGHVLSVADLEKALQIHPEVLVVGCGFFGLMRVPEETSRAVRERGILLYALPTRKAWKLYNKLASENHRVAAAFHVAC